MPDADLGPRTPRILLDGFLTGLLLQIAVGPVFIFVLNTTVQKTPTDGLLAALAVTTVDYAYIILAALGVGRLVDRPAVKRVMQIAGGLVLAVFGVMALLSAAKAQEVTGLPLDGRSDPLGSFVAAFVLTSSSPLTIVFWTGLFAAKATEKGYGKSELIPFGLGAGASTAVFLGSAVIVFSAFTSSIPPLAVRILNCLVGAVLLAYGLIRTGKGLRSGRPKQPD